MPFIILYFIKLSVSVAVVFLFYYFVLRKLTFYNWNRWYLLGYTILSFFIPFIDLSQIFEKYKWTDNSVVQWVPVIGSKSVSTENVVRSNGLFTAGNIVMILIVAGMFILLLRLLLQFISFRKMTKNAKMISGNGTKIYQVDENIIPFSFGSSIFINQHLHSATELQEIIRHEFVHVKQVHSIDIIWGELLCLLNWFNPFAWLIRRAIRQNLEFIADNKVVENGVNKKEYQYLLLKVIGNSQYSIAAQFNFSSLKKRIAMMNKMKSAKAHLVKFLILLPVLAIILVSFRKQMNSLSEKSNREVQTQRTIMVNDTLPDNVKQINVNKNKVRVTLKNGSKEHYDLNNTAEKKEFERKYGEIPPPPPPPDPPAPPSPDAIEPFSDLVEKMNINAEAKYVEVWLKDGKKESYNLKDKSEKTAFEKKYGKIPPPPPPPAPNKQLNEVVTTLNGDVEKVNASLEGPSKPSAYDGITVRMKGQQPLVVLDGEIVRNDVLAKLDPNSIQSIDVLKDKSATTAYGEKGKDGVLIIKTKSKGLKETNPLIVLDGKIITKEEMDNISPHSIESVNVLKGKTATDLYPDKGKDGVIVITSVKKK